MKSANFFVFALVALAALVTLTSAQTELNIPDNLGKDFVIGFGPNAGDESYILTLSSRFNTTVSISFGTNANAVAESFDLTAGVAIQKRYGTSTALSHEQVSAVRNKGIRITSLHEIAVAGTSLARATSDALMALPVDVLGSEYFVAAHDHGYGSNAPFLLIIAPTNGVVVTITPIVSMNGHPAGVPFTVTLNALDSYLLMGTADVDITGTTISSTEPVSVIVGHKCANVPHSTVTYCDHIVNQLPPLSSTGKSFVLDRFHGRGNAGDWIRIAATKDNTVVTVNGVNHPLNKNGVYSFTMLTSAVITSNEPIIVLQLMKGKSADRTRGDPALAFASPIEQFSNNYIFSSVGPLNGDNSHHINLIAPTGKIDGVYFDDVAIPTTEWTAIGSDYMAWTKKISVGSHSAYHTSPNVGINLVVYGFGDYDSYAFPGGQRFAKLGSFCVPSTPQPNDGIDNDCDGRIDEEIFNSGIDADGDGKFNEDYSVAPPSGGGGGGNCDNQAFDPNIDWTGNVATISNPSTGTCACLGA